MDYPRNEGFVRQSSSSSSRLRDPYEHVNRGGGGGGGGGELSHRLARRSPSPEEVPQEMGVDQRSGSAERRDYGWDMNRRRIGRTRPRSPTAAVSGDTGKRSHYDNGTGNSPENYSPSQLPEPRQKRGELGEQKNPNLDNDDPEFHHNMQAYRYVPSDPRSSKEEFNGIGVLAGDNHQSIGKESVPVKGLSQGSYHHSPTDLGPNATPGYVGGTSGKIPPFHRTVETQPHFEQGRVQYKDTPPNRLTVAHSYKDAEKPMIQSRDVPYHMIPGSKSKGLSSSSEMSRHEYLAYREGSHFPQTDEFKSSVKIVEPPNLNVYREIQHPGSTRDPEGAQRNPTYYVREYSPDNGEHENYYYVKSQEVADDRGYPVDEMHKMAVQQGQPGYGRTQVIYNNRDMLRPGITHAVVERNDNIDVSGGNMRRTITYYHPVEKPNDSNYIDMRRGTHVSKQGVEIQGPRYVEVRRTVPADNELLHMGSASKDHRISDMEPEYVFEGDIVGPQFQEERLILHSPVSKYETEVIRRDVRMQGVRDPERIYKPQDRVMKGKFSIQEDVSSYNPRKTFPGKLYSSGEYEELHESGEEWINEKTGEVYTSRPRVIQQQLGYRRMERKYEQGDRDEYVSSDEWFPSEELPHSRKHSAGFHKPYSRPLVKDNRRPGYVNHHYNSQQYDRKDNHLNRQRNQGDRRNQQPYRQHNHFDRRNHHQHHQVYRQQKNWKRNDGYHDNMRADDGNNDRDPSEYWVGRQESALAEDSEEFNQLVQEAFLKYCRDLNVNSSVQRRYKEEGRLGSLFCIVCGRSASKEFLDTRRLVTHAFMSHKSGLRASHLGLHKAICVLLGWSTEIPDETITWVPRVLPRAEALAQKEDLILWPPVVVIHNISFSDRKHDKWKVVTVDAIESFIRGKGCIRSRIKVVLGKPADQSVLVVKFLGTFTGLGDAERLHKYFVESKHGRAELELGSLNGSSEISDIKDEEIVEEKLLYGYLGISEDLDRVDYNTRYSGLVKSKIEILDLANDPVRPDEVQQ